jgi:serine/threonine-protein kinase
MTEDQRTTGEKIASGIALGLFGFVIVLGIILARGNVRAGRSDWKGAAKLALFCFVLMMAAMIFFAHHAPTTDELSLLLMMAGWSLVGTGLVWLLYVALEPHVRKRWPTSLVSWSRLLAGEVLDPVVGRDVLVGVLTGVFWATISRAANLVPGWMGKTPLEPANSLDYIILGGIHYTIGDILLNVMIYLFGSLVLFFIFFLLRLVLRREWLAITVTVVLLSIQAAFGAHAVLNVTQDVVVVGMALLLLVRFGLLALLVAFSLNNVLQAYPLTGHFSEWYAQPTIVVFLLISALGIFGFYTATAGKSRLGNISFDG